MKSGKNKYRLMNGNSNLVTRICPDLFFSITPILQYSNTPVLLNQLSLS
ncbi:hypothetical protein D1AOALGA4SA_11616 [Olavius algarvensis Delta 1 endosymbiont]|nr:hypothetical protein D1AOALGA4SA_11616 [Olavius algarvensis Delta 1 endosymbiont]